MELIRRPGSLMTVLVKEEVPDAAQVMSDAADPEQVKLEAKSPKKRMRGRVVEVTLKRLESPEGNRLCLILKDLDIQKCSIDAIGLSLKVSEFKRTINEDLE